MTHHPFRDAADQQRAQPGATLAAHDDEVSLHRDGKGDNDNPLPARVVETVLFVLAPEQGHGSMLATVLLLRRATRF